MARNMTNAELQFDLNETLKAVLYFWGAEGAQKVTAAVLEARQKREKEIDG